MKKVLLLVVAIGGLLFGASQPAQAANHFVRAGANGNGSDWTNACPGFSGSCAAGSLVRGDTYYVASGSYAAPTLSTSTSGSALITIKGATVADHGSDTGWSTAYSVSTADGGSPAVWTGTIRITTSYWVFDGNTHPSMWDQTPTDYGFSFGTNLSQGFTLGSDGASTSNNGPAITQITLSHMYGKSTTSDVEREFIEGATSGGAHSNVTISYSLLDGWQGLFMTKGQSGTAYSNWVVLGNALLNGYSSSNNHGEWIDPNERPLSNCTIAFNLFKGYSGSAGQTGTIVANNSDNNNALIYGNVFDTLRVGNGVITGTSAGNLNNAVVYNNTFLNMTSDSGNAIGGSGQGSGNVAANNLFYNTNASFGDSFTHDWDAFFSTSNTPSEGNGQVATGSPFVNASAANYHLVLETKSGTTLPAPYNVDVDGNTRPGPDGVWSRGVYQYGGTNTSSAPKPPTSLSATVN
jgi:hypothetical protein